MTVPQQPSHDVRPHPAETDHAQLHGPTLYPRKRGASRPEEARARVRPEPDSSSCSSGVGVRAVDAIELHEAEGALERIESWLRERGFFAPGGEDLMADLYLGYGLSSTIRRRTLARAARALSAPVRGLFRPTAAHVSSVTTVQTEASPLRPVAATWGAASTTARQSSASARRSREATSTRSTSCSTSRRPSPATRARSPPALAPLQPHNPEPYRGDGWAVVSGSPELFLARRGRRVWTCPIKGTRPAGLARRELARLGEGRGRARDDRRPRAERPLARLRARQRALARADGDPRARGRRAHGLDGRGDAAGRSRPGGAAGRDLPRRVDHRRPQDRGRRPDRRSSSRSAAGPRWARSAASTATATSTWR